MTGGFGTMSASVGSIRVRNVSLVRIPEGPITFEGELIVPENATGIVLFAHGSGSSRHSLRNQYVARVIGDAGIGTLLFDLLTPQEEAFDNYSHNLRFDIPLLARRLVSATYWLATQEKTKALIPGYFGASTGGGAALMAAAALGAKIGAVVSRGGRPDLAGPALARVGGADVAYCRKFGCAGDPTK